MKLFLNSQQTYSFDPGPILKTVHDKFIILNLESIVEIYLQVKNLPSTDIDSTTVESLLGESIFEKDG